MSEKIDKLLEFGIINIDKPRGPTSFAVGQFVMRSLGLRKTSHLGTLDPQVTGVLPIMINRACKLSEFLMRKDKRYVGVMRLHGEVGEGKLKKEVKKFVGKISQLPPVRSRVKRAERERDIFSFDILEKDGKDVLFECEVEAGTYVRKLVHDLGEMVGGAHMLELRRVKAGIFGEENLVDLYEFEKAVEEFKEGDDKNLKEMIVPAEEVVRGVMSCVELGKKELLAKILVGSPLHDGDVSSEIDKIKEGEIFGLFSDEKFIGIYRKVSDSEKGEILAKPEFVRN